MVVTPHVLFGSLIYKICEKLFKRNNQDLNQSPLLFFLVLVLAFCSHFILDNIPHTEYSFLRPNLVVGTSKLLFDISLAIFLLLLSINCYPNWKNIKTQWATVLAGFSAILPDIIANSSRVFHSLFWFTDSHNKLHTSVIPTFWVGILTQLIAIVVTCLLLRYVSKIKTQ
jgi:hypothetical protein